MVLSAVCILTAAAVVQGNPIPQPTAPPENPLTLEKAVLGKILFFEEQMSSDGTVACGTCHVNTAGFTDPREGVHPGLDGGFQTPDDVFGSPGIVRQGSALDFAPDALFRLREQITPRRTPDVFGALYNDSALWDGGAGDTFVDPVSGQVSIATGGALESQIAGPPVSDVEMAHEGRDWAEVALRIREARPLALATDLPADVANAIAAHGDYPSLFEGAYGDDQVTAERIIHAIASYERTLVPDQVPWALWMAGNTAAMTPGQVAGWQQFNGPANCSDCHAPPTFTDGDFHNMGLRPIAQDSGRQGVTGNFADRGKFKTPSLLNAGLRESFFHTGQFTSLNPQGPPPPPGVPGNDVGGFYLAGGGPNLDNKDPLLVPLAGQPGINMGAIMDFVGNGLTDPRVAAGTYPFDRPTLRSEREPAGSNLYGTGTAGRAGVPPLRLVAHLPTILGGEFRLGLQGGPAGRTALVGASWQTGLGTPQQGITRWIGPLLRPLVPVTLQDDGSGAGLATLHATLPAQAALWGRTLRLQAFLSDPLAPSGATATRAAEFTVY